MIIWSLISIWMTGIYGQKASVKTVIKHAKQLVSSQDSTSTKNILFAANGKHHAVMSLVLSRLFPVFSHYYCSE